MRTVITDQSIASLDIKMQRQIIKEMDDFFFFEDLSGIESIQRLALRYGASSRNNDKSFYLKVDIQKACAVAARNFEQDYTNIDDLWNIARKYLCYIKIASTFEAFESNSDYDYDYEINESISHPGCLSFEKALLSSRKYKINIPYIWKDLRIYDINSIVSRMKLEFYTYIWKPLVRCSTSMYDYGYEAHVYEIMHDLLSLSQMNTGSDVEIKFFNSAEVKARIKRRVQAKLGFSR